VKQKNSIEPIFKIPIGSPETSVRYYQSTLRNNPEERIFHLHSGRTLKFT